MSCRTSEIHRTFANSRKSGRYRIDLVEIHDFFCKHSVVLANAFAQGLYNIDFTCSKARTVAKSKMDFATVLFFDKKKCFCVFLRRATQGIHIGLASFGLVWRGSGLGIYSPNALESR